MPTYVAGDDDKDANYELFLGGGGGLSHVLMVQDFVISMERGK